MAGGLLPSPERRAAGGEVGDLTPCPPSLSGKGALALCVRIFKGDAYGRKRGSTPLSGKERGRG